MGDAAPASAPKTGVWMRSLELRIPPAALVLATAFVMWLAAWASPSMRLTIPASVALAIGIALMGALVILAGVIEFRRAGTTVNPMNPNAASTLVVRRVYASTRNPMYLGFVMILLAWAVFLSHPLSFLIVPGFIAYMNRFQIVPEERALEGRFGAEFKVYTSRVRRWL
jgi:protein-S-isoprenylcysteine O-methyltransferase Ste14